MRKDNIAKAMQFPEIAAALTKNQEDLQNRKIFEHVRFFLAMCTVNALIGFLGYRNEDRSQYRHHKISPETRWTSVSMLTLITMLAASYMFPAIAAQRMMFFPTQHNNDEGAYPVIYSAIKNDLSIACNEGIKNTLEQLKQALFPKEQDNLMNKLLTQYVHAKQNQAPLVELVDASQQPSFNSKGLSFRRLA